MFMSISYPIYREREIWREMRTVYSEKNTSEYNKFPN